MPGQLTSPYVVLGRRRSSRTTAYAPVGSSLRPRHARHLTRHTKPVRWLGCDSEEAR